MASPASASTSFLFVALCAVVAAGLVIGVSAALRRAGAPSEKYGRWVGLTAAGVGAWLLFTAGLATAGVLRQWDALPPRLLLVLLPPVVLTVFLLRARRVGAVLAALQPALLIAPQVFRVGVELLLWQLYREGAIPEQMTFEGRNWDVLVGLTAPLVAGALARGWGGWALALGWNVAGLLILANIVVVAILSTPLPFRVFLNEPANTIIAEVPYVWLPALLVPVAYLLHLLSLRQWWRQVTAQAVAPEHLTRAPRETTPA